MARELQRWTARSGLLLLLAALVWKQVLDFRAEPITSNFLRHQALIPRLTICPVFPLTDYILLRDNQHQLSNGSLSMAEYYDAVTLQILSGELYVPMARPSRANISVDGPLGVWRQRYYLMIYDLHRYRFTSIDVERHRYPMRCVTFEPSAYLHQLGDRTLEMILKLPSPQLFLINSRHPYAVFVHGDDEPNVGDLDTTDAVVQVPKTNYARMLSHGSSYRVTAKKVTQLMSLRRRPCRSEPGYSVVQCLKECHWRRLAAHTGCRLPHMVSAGVSLPDLHGPLDHLPVCRKLVQTGGIPPVPCDKRFQYRQTLSKVRCWVVFAQNTTRPDLQPTDVALLPESCMGSYQGSACLISLEELIAQYNITQYNCTHCPLPDVEQTVPLDLLSDLHGCQCPPACTQVEYDVLESERKEPFFGNPCEVELQLEMEMDTTKLVEMHGFTISTLLANIGGFIGLITGFSVFTLVDVTEALVVKVKHVAG